MKTRRIVFLIVASCIALATTGCFNSNPDEQSVPWSRPAEWERSAPGFGG